ncbi:hypothetical protein [Sphingorhabdus sp.]|uniref:hypothetical protein n=1 Tax=Sphingorhabdus sp. TaxID=1902408 RepID=UPI00398372BE
MTNVMAALFFALAACSVSGPDGNGGGAVNGSSDEVYDIRVTAMWSCQAEAIKILEHNNLRSRTNAPASNDQPFDVLYGWTDRPNAEKIANDIRALKCLNKVVVQQTKKGDLCPSC